MHSLLLDAAASFCHRVASLPHLPALSDDYAPAASKALWLGTFYLCMPTGVALGYLFGGAVGSGVFLFPLGG